MQHRIYFTETDHGYIVCDSEDQAKHVQQQLDDGLPLDEIDAPIKYTEGERQHKYECLD